MFVPGRADEKEVLLKVIFVKYRIPGRKAQSDTISPKRFVTGSINGIQEKAMKEGIER